MDIDNKVLRNSLNNAGNSLEAATFSGNSFDNHKQQKGRREGNGGVQKQLSDYSLVGGWEGGEAGWDQ